MTTIIVKNANFSGGKIANYTPPVAGASLCAFVGDADESTWLRNFGSGANLVVGAGKPASVDAAFRRFGASNFLQSDTPRTPATTMLAVYRSITPVNNYSAIISSERDYTDNGRRGCALHRINTQDAPYAAAFGTNAAGTAYQALTSNLEASTSLAFAVGLIEDQANGVRVQVLRKTAPAQNGPSLSPGLVSMKTMPDEASYPLRIGHTYRSFQGVEIDIGFVAVYPRILTSAEIESIYQSVARRFTALGITI